jgi:hypothetical protein
MTIHQGMMEAFRRLGCTEAEITHAMRVADSYLQDQDLRNTPINQGAEERFVAVYIALISEIQQGPARQAAEAYIQNQLENN